MHALRFGFAVPGARPAGDHWLLQWEGTAIAGIVNVTPDSFSDGGRHESSAGAVRHARRLLDEGALFIDIGAESTRPGARPVPEREELARLLPVVEQLAADGRGVISVDTMKPAVARAALQAGAHLVNDVSGLRDPRMVEVCAERRAPVVIMHMLGEPRTMQLAPHYDDVSAEVLAFLDERASLARRAGIPAVLLDPGIGFGKTLEHNLTLLRELPRLTAGAYPVLVGASRKRLIDLLAGVPQPDQRDPGSIALHLHAAQSGAAVVRVHDVAGHAQALKVWAGLARLQP